MNQIKLTTNEALLYIALFNTALGILFGSVPLILGFIKKERSYAVFGFLGSVIGGALLGILVSIPVAAIFTWLILRKPKNQPTEVRMENENSVDLNVKNVENPESR